MIDFPFKFRIAVVDDEEIVCKRLKRFLEKEGYLVETFLDGESFLQRMANNPFNLVVLDLKLPQMDGLQVLERIKTISADTEVIIVTAYGSIESAIEATKIGAFHYITKPIKLDEFYSYVNKAKEKVFLTLENKQFKETLARYTFRELVGKSSKMQKVYELIIKVAPVDCNVLIQGETGTGKELVAKAIHYHSPRKRAPFVSFNCGGFTEELIASELFGYEKGAFTGAYYTKIGLLESANGGTVFLDEIGEMPLSMQVKLLRVLQEKKIMRVGGVKPISLDVRIIAATNRDIKKMVEEGTFREDLFYRLNVVNIVLPPLRERKEDIPLLINHFLNKYNALFGKDIKGISQEALSKVLTYPFPGNVRELENMIERAVALAEKKEITLEDLPPDLNTFEIKTEETITISPLEEQEKNYIKQVLEQTGYNKIKAAKILGLSRTTLWRKMKKYGLQ